MDAVDAIVQGAAPARYLVAGDGPLGAALRERAAEIAPDLVVVQLRASETDSLERFRKAAAEEKASPRLADAAELGPVPFLAAWLRDSPEEAMVAVALADAPAAPAIVPGFDSMPSGAVWRPVRAGTAATKHEAAALEEALDAAGEALSGARDGDAAALESAVRHHFSRLANDLGRRLALAGGTAAAREAFVSASALLPGAPSAILNLASLERASGNADHASRARLAGMLQNLRPSGGILAAESGVLLKAEDFFEAGWFWTVSGIPATDPEAARSAFAALPSSAQSEQLSALARISFSLQRGASDPVVGICFAEMPEAASRLSPEARLKAAKTLADASGDFVRASALVARFAAPGAGGIPAGETVHDGTPFWVAAGAAAADSLARRGDAGALDSFSGALLAAAAAKEPSASEAANAAAIGPANVELARWNEAAKAFTAGGEGAKPFAAAAADLAAGGAAAAKAALSPVLEKDGAPWYALRMALEASIRLVDRDGAAESATALLALRSRDAFAHWALGSIAAQKGDKATALRHLQTSVASRPTWISLNDLASILVETGNAAQAENYARMAVAAAGTAVPALRETLGEALEAGGKTAEAAAEYARAVADAEKSGQDPGPRLRLHLAETLLATGDADGAAAQLPLIDRAKDSLSVDERTRLGALRRKVSP